MPSKSFLRADHTGSRGAACCGLVLALAACSLRIVSAQWTSISAAERYSGDGTFYCQTASDDAGSCGFGSQFANSQGLPWSDGVVTRLALNQQQYNGSLACGLCAMFRGTGKGIGMTPISKEWTMGMITNRCGECAFGAIDLCSTGDGRWGIEWYPVPCNVGQSKFRFDMFGQPSPYWFSFTVSNTRVPVQLVEMKDQYSGKWAPMRRGNPDNHWNANGGPFKMPVQLRLTSVEGDSVEDTISGWSGGQGISQFPAKAGTGSKGTTAAAAASAAAKPSQSGPQPSTTKRSPPSAASSTSSSGSSSGASSSSSSGSSSASASASSTKSPSPPPSEAQGNPASGSQSGSNASSDNSGSKGQQSGQSDNSTPKNQQSQNQQPGQPDNSTPKNQQSGQSGTSKPNDQQSGQSDSFNWEDQKPVFYPWSPEKSGKPQLIADSSAKDWWNGGRRLLRQLA